MITDNKDILKENGPQTNTTCTIEPKVRDKMVAINLEFLDLFLRQMKTIIVRGCGCTLEESVDKIGTHKEKCILKEVS